MNSKKSLKAAEFVCSVWNYADEKGYASIQWKSKSSSLKSHFFSLPVEASEVSDVLQTVPEGQDIYFCPLPGQYKSRKKESYTHSRLLWADLDEVNPHLLPKPTIAWETSPNRFQALWFLDKKIPANQAEVINKNLTYKIGADKGGWDLGQILRLPYTTNFKPQYDEPQIKVLWKNGHLLKEDQLKKLSKNKKKELKKNTIINPPVEMSKKLQEQWFQWEEIPIGDRSEVINSWVWSLLSRGVHEEHVTNIVSSHPLTVEKYGDRALREVERSVEKYEPDSSFKITKKRREEISFEWDPKILSLPHLLAQDHTPKWLIKDIWTDNSVGIIAGDSKHFKTWIAFDMAVSIATGTNFLGIDEYSTKQRGKSVLIIQGEDGETRVGSRLARVIASKGKGPKVVGMDGRVIQIDWGDDIPIHVICSAEFNLEEPDCVVKLEQIVKDNKIEVVVMDPLVGMLGDTDEFRAGSVIKLLKPIKVLRDRYGTSFIIVHHNRKPSKEKQAMAMGDEMYGSFALKAWLECGIHLGSVGDVARTRTISIRRQFKSAPSGDDIAVYFPDNMNEKYETVVSDLKEAKQKIKDKKKKIVIDDDVSRIYTALKKGPRSGTSIWKEFGWRSHRGVDAINKGIQDGLFRYDGAGRNAKLTLTD